MEALYRESNPGLVSNIGIYLFLNDSGKAYVGQSSNLKKRKYEHSRQLQKGKHVNCHLQHSFNKYGGLYFFILEYLPDTALLTEREQYWIDYFDSYNSGMNLTPFAATSLGCVRTEEQRQVISEITKEFWGKEENRKAQSERKKKFYENNPEAIRKMSEIAKRLLEENPEKAERHSEFMKQRSSSEEYKSEFKERMTKWRESLSDEQRASITAKMQSISDEERKRASRKGAATRSKLGTTRDNDPACFVGVHWQTLKTRKGTPHLDACARWTEPKTGVNKLKRFSAAKYGLMPAFYMACKFRSEVQVRLNAEYAEILNEF